MKNSYQLSSSCFLLFFILGFFILPTHEVFAKKADNVLMKLTFQVDMKYQEVHPKGVFITCNILNGHAQTKMEKVSASVWALTIDAPIGYEVLWKFLNGPDNFEPTNEMEICAIGSTPADSVRTHITANHDEVLPPVCYGQCTTCPSISPTHDTWLEDVITLSPNPAVDMVLMKYAFGKTETLSLRLHNSAGRLVRSWEFGKVTEGQQELELDGLGAGVYWAEVRAGESTSFKQLIIR